MFYQIFSKKIKNQSIDTSKFPDFDTEFIFSKLKKYREEVNHEFNSFNISSYDIRVKGVRDISHFPLGFCDVIRDRVYDKAQEEGLVQELEQRGIVFKKVFGILNDSCFHNMFQIGNYIVDISRDSIEEFNDFFVATSIKNSKYKNIESYEKMFEIMEKYWKVEIYPNTLFPEISYYFPYFLKYLDGEIHFKTTHCSIPLFNEMQSDFNWTHSFLKKSICFKYDEKTSNNFERLNRKYSYLFMKKSDDEALEDYYRRFLQSRISSGKENFDAQMMEKIMHLLNSFNRDLNK
ncbi:MAG: hypothetical protein ACLFPL_05470 [Candidatus Nanoarchaeia archaeon]